MSHPWRRYGVCAEYVGAHHLEGEQLWRDIRRSERRAAAGVIDVRIVRQDLQHGTATAVARIEKVLRARGWRPGA